MIAHSHLSSPGDLVTSERQVGREKRPIPQPKAEDVAVYQVKLVNHDITRGKKQLHPLEAEHTRKVAFIGCVRGCSISGADWHIQREVLGESHEVFSGCICGTVEAHMIIRSSPKNLDQLSNYLNVFNIPCSVIEVSVVKAN